MNDLKVSVVIPTYNRASLLDYSLSGLKKQRPTCPSFQVIVVDDGSSDNTFDIARSYDRDLDLEYLFQPDRGYRPARARNCGLRLARGKITVFLDCGNIPGARFVEAHVAAHARGESTSAVVGYIYGFDQTGDNAEAVVERLDLADVEGSIERLQQVDECLDIRDELYRALDDDLREGPTWAMFWTGNVSVDTRFALETGGFDEWFQSWGGEDIEFGLSLHRRGAEFVLARDAAAIQYPHHKDVGRRLESLEKNKQYIHRKHQLQETEDLLRLSSRRLLRQWLTTRYTAA